MSGGSYDYLYLKDADELINEGDNLFKLIDRLSKTPHGEKAYRDTVKLQEIINKYEREVNSFLSKIDKRTCPLRHVWKTVEWVDSGDWSEKDLEEVLVLYTSSQKKTE